jgi:hypothetical protein
MRLMISVISAKEATDALSGGADILDVKNPSEGSLGAQSPSVIREIRQLASGKALVSAAIGDVPNLPGTAALAAVGAASCGVDFIKVGLHGPRSEADAVALMREVRQAVREFHTIVIAALYADHRRAGTLDPACLPEIAARAGLHGCLLDTAVKDGHTLFDFIGSQALRALVERSHEAGLSFGAAGALGEQDLARVQECGADIAGLRTAVCRCGHRAGPLEASRIDQLRRILVPTV